MVKDAFDTARAEPWHVRETIEREVTQALDSGQIDPGEALEALAQINDATLSELDPMVKCRLMGVLAREVHGIRNDPERMKITAERHYGRQLITAGQRLALATPMPEKILDRFLKVEDAFIAEFEAAIRDALTEGERVNLSERFDDETLAATVQYFNERFAHHYGTACGVESILLKDKDGKLYGQAGWDDKIKKVVIESNVSQTRMLKDFPLLAVTLGHEGAHGLMQHLWQRVGDPERLREAFPDLYTLMRLTDRTFYSTDEAVYRKHPEEIFVERIGLRIGVRMARTLGMDVSINDFAQSAQLYPNPKIVQELARLFPAESTERASGAAAKPPRQTL